MIVTVGYIFRACQEITRHATYLSITSHGEFRDLLISTNHHTHVATHIRIRITLHSVRKSVAGHSIFLESLESDVFSWTREHTAVDREPEEASTVQCLPISITKWSIAEISPIESYVLQANKSHD